MDGGLLWQVAVSLAAAAAVYGGIRADIRHLHSEIGRVSGIADKAHDRIDVIAMRRRCGDGE